jgi:hypothetical protein
MRSVIYGVLITVFLASAGTVQAGELDGKALLCTTNYSIHYPVYGLVFDKGKVRKLVVEGYSKTILYTQEYFLTGTKVVNWLNSALNRETLKIGSDQCSISSNTEISQKLDEIIATGKKKNKL